MLYRPEIVLCIGWALYGIIFLTAPLVVNVDVQAGSLLYIAVTSLAFVVGSVAANFLSYKSSSFYVSSIQQQKREAFLFNLFVFIGIIGNVLRIVDKYVLRSSEATNVLGAREMLADTSSSVIGMLGGVLYPFGYLAFFIYLSASFLPRSGWRLVIALMVFLIPTVDGLLLYSRSIMLVAMTMLYFGVSLAMFGGRLFPKKLLLPTALLVFAVAIVSVLIFFLRIGEMQLALEFSMFQSAYAYTVQPTENAAEYISAGGIASSWFSGFILLAQYYLHGFFELQLLWEGADRQIYSHGALLFAPILKPFNILGVLPATNLAELIPRLGVFTTFYGPLWVDFGWVAPFVMFIFGIVARRLGIASQHGDYSTIPLYTYVCVILVFAPVVNFAISTQGMYCIIAFSIYWISTRKIARSQVQPSQ